MSGRTEARLNAYAAIDSERSYQNERWANPAVGGGTSATAGHNPHSVAEWLVYMQHYVNEGLKAVTLSNDPMASAAGLQFARKVAALGVACMEQHGAPLREGY